MLERTKKFVSTHKSHIITAATSVVVGGAAVVLYHKYGPKNYLVVPNDMLKKLGDNPQEVWVGFETKGILLAMTAVPKLVKI